MFASSVDLNKFLATLDVRYEKKVAKAGGTVAKKRRVVGHPSDTSIPPGAPRWMINQGMQVFRLQYSASQIRTFIGESGTP